MIAYSYHQNLQDSLQIVPILAQPFDNNLEDTFMSKRHYAMHAAQSHSVVATIVDMDYNQIEDCYGIQIDPNGIVHDGAYNQNFDSLSEWAEWCIANDEYETLEHVRNRSYGALT